MTSLNFTLADNQPSARANDNSGTLEEQFRQEIVDAGLKPPHEVLLDGRWHRFSTKPDNNSDKNGWYIGFGDGIQAGAFGCWRSGIKGKWHANVGRPLTLDEIRANDARLEAAQAARAKETEARQAHAAEEAKHTWDNAQPATDDHPYLKRKGIAAHGIRVTSGGRLVVPIYDIDGSLISIQYISPDGEKRFLKNARKRGGFFVFGDLANAKRILIGEGFATGATVYKAMGGAVVVAFDCWNLPPVSTALHLKYPSSELLQCADDDWKTDGNPGLTHAMEAARPTGARVAKPVFSGERGDGDSDFNDLEAREGLDAVRRCIMNATKPVNAPGRITAITAGLSTSTPANSQAGDLCAERQLHSPQNVNYIAPSASGVVVVV